MPDSTASFQGYLPEHLRTFIEQRFYARINAQAKLENLIEDPEFVRDPINHVGLFTDHGVVHVRDVTSLIFQVLDAINGVLIPARSRARLGIFMKGYGEILSYLHDIGMINFSAFGRAMHPEFAAQWVFSPEFDPLLEMLWDENCGNMAWRLTQLAAKGTLTQPPKLVLREMLALSICHSKSKVPVDVLNDATRLRGLMLRTVSTDLVTLYQQGGLNGGIRPTSQRTEMIDAEQLRTNVVRLYTAFEREAFAWLVNDDIEVRGLVEDVTDTLRALRCADALRQRGTALKTSGSYEIFTDQTSAYAVVALRRGDDQLFLLSDPAPHSGGQANLASSELGLDGNLRISFHRGSFANAEMVERAAYFAAVVVDDIQSDVIGSFQRAFSVEETATGIKAPHEIMILLEGVNDNLDFAPLIIQELLKLNPSLAGRVRVVPCLQAATAFEREIYLTSAAVAWDEREKLELLAHIEQSGHKVAGIDLQAGFEDVRRITLKAGDVLIEAGMEASFVYIPLGDGLKVMPIGGYQPFFVCPWIPLGSTGVIRGSVRNATVIADREVHLLMIPKETYLRYWHAPYSVDTLMQRLRVEQR